MSNKIQTGLHIFFDEYFEDDAPLNISGTYSTFVNCGSQYAIWHQFPRAIRYLLKDLDSGEEYISVDNELSISPSGNQIYDSYAKKECNKVVAESFSIILSDVYFINPPTHPLKNIEVSCRYYNDSSNAVKILNKSLQLKTF